MQLFDLKVASGPLLVSIPHSGLWLSEGLTNRLTVEGLKLSDTDWHIPRLYDFLDEFDVSVIKANYSRYVVDLNRPITGGALYAGQRETEICPTTTFTDQSIYLEGKKPSDDEVISRTDSYWRPYHQCIEQELQRIKNQHGYALLWDAHSIQSQLPRFFEGTLPDLNMGTDDGKSCSHELSEALTRILTQSPFRVVRNGRFKGGHITRHYGAPEDNVHAVQLEIAQVSYMSEYPDFEYYQDRANKLRPVLNQMIKTMMLYDPAALSAR